MKTVHSLFEDKVREMPDAIAAIVENQFITYDELNKKSNRLAHYLREKGVQPDTSIAICLDRSIDLLITMWAILKAGASYVPLDISHPIDRVLFILRDTNAPILFTTSSLKEEFSGYDGTLILLDKVEKSVKSYPDTNPKEHGSDENLAYIIYTSGSTGLPKGVLIEHKNVVNYCHWYADYSGAKPQQRIDFSSNYIFDMAVTISIVPLMLGLTIVICSDKTKKNLQRYLRYLQSNKINIIKMTPSYMKVLANEAKSCDIALPHLYTLILGGENLHTLECRAWLDIYPEHTLYNEYGPTETTVGVSSYKINASTISELEVNVPIGFVDKKLHYYLLGDDQQPVPDGDIGELYIGGVCLARGYLNQTSMTEEKFINDPFSQNDTDRLYRTGDLCRQLPGGMLEYFGRVDQQVKINGFRIQLEEIEQHLVAYPDVKDAIVLVKENLVHEKQLVAYYIPKKNTNNVTSNQLRQYLQERLPNYMIPTVFIWVDSFPRTANDKLDPLSLPAPQFSRAQHYIAPRTRMEKALTEIWSEALGLNPIGIKDNLFELGGHSLTAARIVSKIEKILEKEITLEDLYHAPTIKELVSVLRQSKPVDKSNLNDRATINKSTVIPLNDFQFMFWVANLGEPDVKRLNVAGRKRLKGVLDTKVLHAAFDAILKQQDVFSYQTSLLSPAQKAQKKIPFKLDEIDFQLFSKEDCELELSHAFNKIINYGPWKKNKYSLIAQLFYLPGQQVELQISMPHIISDYTSVDIFFVELSKYYLLHSSKVKTQYPMEQEKFKLFLEKERVDLDRNTDRNLAFWKNYLIDAEFFSFPPAVVVEDMVTNNYDYSTYRELSEQGLNNLQQYCAEMHVSLTDGLCATLGLALATRCNYAINKTKKIFMGLVKSTRDNPIYDDKIGCFLRLDAIKVDVCTQPTLANLCKQIHQSTIDTMVYQPCSGMAKLSAVGTLDRKSNPIATFLMNKAILLYTKLFRSSKINHKLLSFYTRLMPFWKNDEFLIYINILTNFLPSEFKKESSLFGLETSHPTMHKYDLSTVKHVLEVCFLRDEKNNIPYLVVSANLKPAIRELIAEEMIRIIQHETMVLKEQVGSAIV